MRHVIHAATSRTERLVVIRVQFTSNGGSFERMSWQY